MNLNEINEKVNGTIITTGIEGLDVSLVYAGDFLSRVMGRAPENSIWLTVMNNVNVAGVAVLADLKVVVLCEGVTADKLLVEKCKNEDIALIQTELTVYDACKAL